MFDLTDKVALVTGARRGMGKAHALALAEQGAKVVITDIDAGECQSVADEIKSGKGEAVCFKLDVSNKEEVDKVFDEVIKKFGRLDILVNNAGIFNPKAFLEITENEWDKTLDINLKGQFLCAQRAAKEMAKNNPPAGGGRIINISSIASGQVGIGIEWGAHYTASKGGIIGMTETLAIELAPLGINVNAIAPGAIDTPMLRAGAETEELKKYIEKIPLKRIGRPEEVSAAVVFLASDEASYITGSTFYVDGGWLAA
ncbi:MAG: Short-chain dehydrogenase/reductase SDR [Candidatus Giovannonibacteria bacterium GW2011_GWC2_44_9]|uniref:Short-chain dehydrogenase/reductase SDR n=3 Tax=Candidatus Giovannoniibacteriota TaxID=1752738 RepID=A0A0G1IX45_9BACT|nr:MAG: Short-chain dehydrogenase/reductase SDR [Candidatus Giovannonibacteria bacterium GW2011_GWB1_44_23]KKT63971.1 MAG: Short-chain dehydrogenase/reductase SDR [Candidatus Giovannonibacteria bacterium GW2011_GWA1_44_29]KKT83309.1 MAG: Short-chain dehydrogenase/reductase SDR [Candidatus Giovannonibacteria bacterium GW2011_GWC2_44_9]KKT91684.1 MAG: short-chain dehydrogenase/reductase SDR, 3-oxoacyl-[acyl-carrier protein] reductase [Parcubacteria group bacterium GW2011_GWC1_45_13]